MKTRDKRNPNPKRKNKTREKAKRVKHASRRALTETRRDEVPKRVRDAARAATGRDARSVSLASRRDGRDVRAARHGRRDVEHARGEAFFESFVSARRGDVASVARDAPTRASILKRPRREGLSPPLGGNEKRWRRWWACASYARRSDWLGQGVNA